MKPTQYEVIAWAKKSEFSDDEIETCFDGFILLAELAYEAGRKYEHKAMAQNGWRQCAVGQRTTQFCGLLHEAVAAEREACAKVCEAEEQRILSKQSGRDFDQIDTNLRMIACVLPDIAAAIRARGEK